MPLIQSRRRFLTSLSLAGAASFVRIPSSMAAEGTLETTTVRLVYDGTICTPALVAEELLRAEGFTDLRYVDMTWIGAGTPLTLANAGADFKLTTPWDGARRIDGGEPI